jgi:hypothetical protein
MAGADQGRLWSEHGCNNDPVSRLNQGAPLAPSADPPRVESPLSLALAGLVLLGCWGLIGLVIYLVAW